MFLSDTPACSHSDVQHSRCGASDREGRDPQIPMHRLACGNGRQWRETHDEQEVLVIDILLFAVDILLLVINILLCVVYILLCVVHIFLSVVQIPLRVVDPLF